MHSTDLYYHTIASIHGLIGLLIFTTGMLQFILKKGTRLHKIIGYIYLIAWVGILLSGAYIGSPIIVAIVFLGFYLALTGVRAAMLQGKPYTTLDKSIVGIATLIVLFMLAAAILLAIKREYTYATLACFFGVLYAVVLRKDILVQILNKKPAISKYGDKAWYVSHIIRMQSSFITAVGAFTAVQNLFHNTILNFTLPALIGAIVITASTTYLVKKANIEVLKT